MFSENQAKNARGYIRELIKLQKRCDKIVDELLSGKKNVENCVAVVLLARYFKRIMAHLANIASSVVMPVNKLDYFDEDSKVSSIKKR